MGLLYIFFIWTLIPIIVGFIEGIVYLAEDNAKFQRRIDPNYGVGPVYGNQQVYR